jgi:hypothetical protein
MKLISSATPEQLVELSNLLERDATHLPHPAPKSAAVSEPAAPAAAAAEPDPADEKPDVPPLDSEPDRPVEQPAAPATRFELERPVERPAAPAARFELDRAVERPAVSAATSEPERAITKPGALVLRLRSPRATDLLARGAQAEQLGNVSGARRYYASAVQLGSATAARNLGRLYDPVFLKRTRYHQASLVAQMLSGASARPGLLKRRFRPFGPDLRLLHLERAWKKPMKGAWPPWRPLPCRRLLRRLAASNSTATLANDHLAVSPASVTARLWTLVAPYALAIDGFEGCRIKPRSPEKTRASG